MDSERHRPSFVEDNVWGDFDSVPSETPSTGTSRWVDIDEEVKLRIGNIDYVIIETHNFFVPIQLVGPRSNVPFPVPFFVYHTEPGQTITASALLEFRTQVLERDDVFHPRFFTTVIFYGGKEEDVALTPGAEDVLRFRLPGRVCSTGRGLGERVIVPSSCYFKPSRERPFHGVRVGVKDNIDIMGHKTTLNSRAWTLLYPPAKEHAECVQRLIDAGAIIVGKLKLQAMLVREEPSEAVEFTSPFNPRGDGYRTPSGSSSGSAAAIGSYDWLDLALGSDTNGGIRKPAQYNGCFGIRQSTSFATVIDLLNGIEMTDSRIPRALIPIRKPHYIRILRPEDWLPTANKDQTFAIDKFVAGVQKAFRSQKVQAASLSGEEYLQNAGGYPYYKDSYKALQSFRDEYRANFGEQPFVHMYLQWQWNTARDIREEKRDEYWVRLEEYRDFLREEIFKWGSSDTDFTIMVLPIGDGKPPDERGAAVPPPEVLSGVSPLLMSPILRAPEITAIVGERLFTSKITGRREPCPIAVSIIGPPRADFRLAKVVELSMEAAGMPTKLKTGPSVYHDTYEQWSRRPKRTAEDLDIIRDRWIADRWATKRHNPGPSKTLRCNRPITDSPTPSSPSSTSSN
ncbi:amidase [Xylariaceae sp. FL1019]|nr:amidase [Xylariaceae sp. FL1019]